MEETWKQLTLPWLLTFHCLPDTKDFVNYSLLPRLLVKHDNVHENYLKNDFWHPPPPQSLTIRRIEMFPELVVEGDFIRSFLSDS